MMSKILVLSLVYGPDTVSTANLMTDIVRGLNAKGHKLTVLTSMPHYNLSEKVHSNPLYRSKRIYTETYEDGVHVMRVYMPLKRNRIWLRSLDYLWFHFVTFVIALLKVGGQDVVFVPSPPITLGISGFFLAKLLKGELVYEVLELWPDVPIRMGLIRGKLIQSMSYGLESFVYKRCIIITCLARSFMRSLVKRGVRREKLWFTPAFVDVDWMEPRPKENGFSREQNLIDKYVVFYAGNIGLTQGTEIIVRVAEILEHDKNIVILVIGDGAGRSNLEKAISNTKLTNILLLSFQPYERILDTYATADVCISPMRAGFSYDTVPSKIYTAMAAGRPVIAACEPDSETAILIKESGGGVIVTPESAEEMAEAVIRFRKNKDIAIKMGKNGRQWIVDHYSKSIVIDTYDQVIRRAVYGTS